MGRLSSHRRCLRARIHIYISMMAWKIGAMVGRYQPNIGLIINCGPGLFRSEGGRLCFFITQSGRPRCAALPPQRRGWRTRTTCRSSFATLEVTADAPQPSHLCHHRSDSSRLRVPTAQDRPCAQSLAQPSVLAVGDTGQRDLPLFSLFHQFWSGLSSI